ncbi:MAG TPA: hypothetical protein DDZ79_08955, partial [Aequorivita sp.]|nr:hypothetical protein [Aequorivita sp.]
LDEEERKRKRNLYYWLVGGATTVLLGLILLFGNNFDAETQSIHESDHIKLSDQNGTAETDTNQTTFPKQEADSLRIQNFPNEKLSKIAPSKLEETQNDHENFSKNSREMKVKNNSSDKTSVDETFTVSKKYYYYNSKDGKQLVTTNKKDIDSIIAEAYKNIDTTTVEREDSFKQ